MARFIALYLPQYHPFKENDEWWGKGFTEWVNVARARALYKGHVQPHIPKDLGFYDLRLPQVRKQQAELAKQAGIESFCYYDYWFGDKRRLMELPFDEVVKTGEPDFPFCLCWANASWYNKQFDPNAPGKDRLLIEQKYGGEQDYADHFNALLPAFKDIRYTKVNGRLFYMILNPMDFDSSVFVNVWRRLAKENGLPDFYFVGGTYYSRNKREILSRGFDAILNIDILRVHHELSIPKKLWLFFCRRVLKRPSVFSYKSAITYMMTEDCRKNDVIPCIAPNWDHSPRSKINAMVLQDAKPEFFEQLVNRSIDMVSAKPNDEQIVIIKSWNEWGEGNYMEPDLEYGHGYLDALKNAIEAR